MLLRLVQLYILGILLMLGYLMIWPELSFDLAWKPALIWPKTLVEMIQAS